MHIKHKIGTGLLFGAIASVSGILGFTQNTFATPANPDFKDDNLYACVIRDYNAATSSSVPVSTALTDEQLAKVTSLTCLENVADTTGFEKLTGLDRVTFSGSTFTSIDFSNSKPTSISITDGSLANITLGTQPNLTDLKLYNNNLTELDLSGTTALFTLSVANNKLSSITPPKSLVNIYVYDNNLTEINLAGNPHFTSYGDSGIGTLLADDIKVQVGLKTVISNGAQYSNFHAPSVIFGVSEGVTRIVPHSSYAYAEECPILFDGALSNCVIIKDLNTYPGYIQLAYQGPSSRGGSAASGDDPTKMTYKLIVTPSEEDLTPSGGSSSTDQKGPGTPNTGFFGENGLLITIPVGIIAAIAISLAAYYYGYKRYTGRVHFGKGPLGKKF